MVAPLRSGFSSDCMGHATCYDQLTYLAWCRWRQWDAELKHCGCLSECLGLSPRLGCCKNHLWLPEPGRLGDAAVKEETELAAARTKIKERTERQALPIVWAGTGAPPSLEPQTRQRSQKRCAESTPCRMRYHQCDVPVA